MDDAVAEAATGAGRRSGGAKEGGGDGGWDAGAVVFDGELEATGDDAEGDADRALRLGGCRDAVSVVAANGFYGVADEVDGDALEGFGGEIERGQDGRGGDGDGGRAGGDAFQYRGQVAQDGGVGEAGAGVLGQAHIAATDVGGLETECVVVGVEGIDGGVRLRV